ncbi:MAG TPA: NAD(P)H-dependent oxidoreductase [Clostridiales bacterium UBA8960]|nr:NAD(P)H-dependent oxidoreductase [Clostridiales bacterium UBA8960]
MKKAKILAIVGSLRSKSYNLQLANIAKSIVGESADFSILDYSDVPLLNQDIEHPAPASIKRVRDAVVEADAIWFFTPEYNHSIPGVLKNLIDWLSRPVSKTEPNVIGGKPVAISGITTGMTGTSVSQDQLVTLISYLNMNVMNKPRLAVPNVSQQLNDKGELTLVSSMEQLEKQAGAFVKFIEKQKSMQ